MAANETSRSIVRWAARLTGGSSLAFMLFFVGAHIFGDSQGPAPTASERVGLAFFPTGLIVGLAIAFFRAKTGALTALASFAGFHVWHFARAGDLPAGPFFVLLTAPAVLFLISGLLDGPSWRRNTENRKPGPSEKRPEEPGCGLGTAS
jgi:hypothetical protein